MNVADSVKDIYIAPDLGQPMEERSTIEAVAGQWLRGNRYFRDQGLYDREESLPEGTDAMLIEVEALRAAERDKDVSLDPELTRRNIVMKGVRLNHLVDREHLEWGPQFSSVNGCVNHAVTCKSLLMSTVLLHLSLTVEGLMQISSKQGQL